MSYSVKQSTTSTLLPHKSFDTAYSTLDSDQLLSTLLKSLPSAQYRSDLARREQSLLEDKLRPHAANTSPSPDHSTQSVEGSAMADSKMNMFATRGALQKIGAILSKFVIPTAKMEDIAHSSVTTEAGAIVDLIDSQADGLREEAQEDTSNNSKNQDEDDEIEVEYMLIAAKCTTASTPATPRDDVFWKTPRRTRRHRRGNAAKSPVVLKTPPEIKRRRQIITHAKPHRKRRAVPGFI